jgi:putative endopeptidase
LPAAALLVALGCIGQRQVTRPAVRRAPAPRPAAPQGDLLPVNTAADPCLDFASYACGPEGKFGAHRNDLLNWRGAALLRLFDELAAGKHRDGSPGTELLREAYLRCKDPVKRDRGLAELRERLAEIAQIDTLDDFARFLGRGRGGGSRVLLYLEPAWNVLDPLRIVGAEVGLRRPRLASRLYRTDSPLVGELRQHWQRLAELSGVVTPAEAEAAARTDAEFAAKRPPVDQTPVARKEVARSLEPPPIVTADGLEQRRFPWRAYLDGLALGRPCRFFPVTDHALDDIDGLLDVPLADLKAYLKVNLVEDWSEYLSAAFLEEERRYHEPAKGARSQGPRIGAQCAQLVSRWLETQLADAYLTDLAAPELEHEADRLFEVLRGRLGEIVQGAPWLDAATRAASAQKLERVRLRFIGDVEAHGFETLSLPDGSFLDARFRIFSWRSHAELDQIGAPAQDHAVSPSFQAAAFFSRQNVVWVSPEIVRPPFMHARAYDAVTYGALGTVLGHELGHALDPALRRLDDAIRTHETWSQQALTAFDERAACFAATFGRMGASSEAGPGGWMYTHEGMADLTGVELALSVMERDTPAGLVDNPPLARRRAFFLAYAQELCEFEPGARTEVQTWRDPHPPTRLRINATLANVPEFADAFRCAPGAPMAPRQRCAAW